MELNFEGVVVGVMSLVIIGAFHPLVIWFEYHFTQSIWPVFLIAGLLCLIAALFIQGLFSVLLGLLGVACIWSIRELKEQARQGGAGLVSKKSKAEIGRGPAYFHPLDRVRMVLYNYPAVSND